jgi:serine phosphatase RsbU (regulator of sigma subunit)
VGDRNSQSIIYLPIFTKTRCSGVISVQSFEKNQYTEYHLDILRNLAVYASIALNNAEIYYQIEFQKEEIRTQRDTLKEQRDLAQHQKREITDSINYASCIQKAMLPPDEDIRKILGNNYFILNKPLDIVSGDFYWIAKKANKTIIVTADCTGHGVPGAFLSMLGISLLNEIIVTKGVTNAGEILIKLRQNLIKSLHQKGGTHDTHDGIDMALCIFDFEERKLQFAGANSSLYFVYQPDNTNSDSLESKNEIHENPLLTSRLKSITYEGARIEPASNNVKILSKDHHKLIHIRPDRMPVVVHHKKSKAFSNYNFKLKSDDSIYCSTDGYPDQFGGNRIKKYSTKRFKDMLLSIQDYSMKIQKEIIEETHLKWKGENNQIDDILVIGIKV